MVTWKTILILSLAWIFIVSCVGATDYCVPMDNVTSTVIDHTGEWWNITLYFDTCFICSDNGALYGDVDCVPCPTDAPVAGFTSNVTCGIVPFAVQYSDTSTGTNITSWYWDFGDDVNSTLEDPVIWYNVTGIYGVDHNATSEFGTDWLNVSGYMTARPTGDTCESFGNVYDSDDYQSPDSWFTNWLL